MGKNCCQLSIYREQKLSFQDLLALLLRFATVATKHNHYFHHYTSDTHHRKTSSLLVCTHMHTPSAPHTQAHTHTDS